MKITSAVFKKGLTGDDPILHDGLPQIAFVGRSNAGKSSLINTLTNMHALARTSSTPGRTQELNLFLVNKTHYFVDLPGYGYAKASSEAWGKLNHLISWYLLESGFDPKVILIIDAVVGLTDNDLGMLEYLKAEGREIVIVANKIDKVKNSELHKTLKKVESQVVGHKVIPFSSTAKIGVKELLAEIFS